MMTIGDLKKIIEHLPDDMEVKVNGEQFDLPVERVIPDITRIVNDIRKFHLSIVAARDSETTLKAWRKNDLSYSDALSMLMKAGMTINEADNLLSAD